MTPMWRYQWVHAVKNSCLRGLTCGVLDHKSRPPEFDSWRGHTWSVFHLWVHFITFGGRSAHLAYNVYKSGRKTSIINHHHMELNSGVQYKPLIWLQCVAVSVTMSRLKVSRWVVIIVNEHNGRSLATSLGSTR